MSKHYFIAQGQFSNLPAKPEWDLAALLTYVWEYRIEPLLQEYLRGEGDQGAASLLESCKNAFFSP